MVSRGGRTITPYLDERICKVRRFLPKWSEAQRIAYPQRAYVRIEDERRIQTQNDCEISACEKIQVTAIPTATIDTTMTYVGPVVRLRDIRSRSLDLSSPSADGRHTVAIVNRAITSKGCLIETWLKKY